MQKIVINTAYGGFGIPQDMLEWMIEQGCPICKEYAEFIKEIDLDLSLNFPDVKRDDPILVRAVELFPSSNEDLKIVEIPGDVKWTIEEYDGCEWIAEMHRTWR